VIFKRTVGKRSFPFDVLIFAYICIKNNVSSGFGVESIEDSMIEDENGKKKKISCGTEKGKHKCKNNRTAGM
jgi:hypothetical protein